MKPRYGEDIFGRLFLRELVKMRANGDRIALVTDSGFQQEAETVIEAVGAANVLLLQVHATKRGCTFAHDSRSYITLSGVETWKIHNDQEGEIADYLDRVTRLVRGWLSGVSLHPGTSCTVDHLVEPPL
jgi:hypothetical protein